jgi:hypothetical protein
VEEKRNPGNQNDRHVVVFGWSPNTQQFYLQTRNPTKILTKQTDPRRFSLLFLCPFCVSSWVAMMPIVHFFRPQQVRSCFTSGGGRPTAIRRLHVVARRNSAEVEEAKAEEATPMPIRVALVADPFID